MISQTHNSVLMRNAKTSLHRDISTMMLVFLILIILNFISAYIPFGNLLIGGPIAAGFALIALKMYRAQNVVVKDLFTPFDNFGQIFVGYLIISLGIGFVIMMSIMPFIGVAFVGVGDMSDCSNIEQFLNTGDFNIILDNKLYIFIELFRLAAKPLGLSIIFGIVTICIAIYFGLRFSMYIFIAADKPKNQGIDMLKESYEITKNNMGKLIGLYARFIGWDLLMLFTIGIASFYVIPYHMCANAAFYEDIKNKKITFDEDLEKIKIVQSIRS